MSTAVWEQVTNMSDRELVNKLEKMDLPQHRIYRLNKNNLMWLNRNIGVRNSHEYYKEVVEEINLRLKKRIYFS